MKWTEEQKSVIHAPLDRHAVVRAVPGAGKTTTLVGRVVSLVERKVPESRIRVVMFNRSVQETFRKRLDKVHLYNVTVTTFDAMALEVLNTAKRLHGYSFVFCPSDTAKWGWATWTSGFRGRIKDVDELLWAIGTWKSHLVPPSQAVCTGNPALVEAYAAFEEIRKTKKVNRIALEDLVGQAVAVLRKHPRLLGVLDHLCVDEFQDISLARVRLLQGLIHPETAFTAVGDEDQAINEWNGASPRFFADFGAFFPGKPIDVYPLSQTFRFGEPLVSLADRFIRHNENRSDVTLRGVERATRVRHHPGNALDVIRPWITQNISPTQIAILYRSRSAVVSSMTALYLDKVPVLTRDGTTLIQGRALTLFQFCATYATSLKSVSADEAFKFIAMAVPYARKIAFERQCVQLPNKTLRAVLLDATVAKSAGQIRPVIDRMRRLGEVLTDIHTATSASEAIEILTRRLDLREILHADPCPAEEAQLADATWSALRVLFRAAPEVTLAGARAYLSTLDMTQGKPEGECIRAMTIHTAKGMEWSRVLFVGMSLGTLPPIIQDPVILASTKKPQGLDASDPVEQERRVTYVGMTRGIDEVVLQHPESQKPSIFLVEMDTIPEPTGTHRHHFPSLESRCETCNDVRFDDRDDDYFRDYDGLF